MKLFFLSIIFILAFDAFSISNESLHFSYLTKEDGLSDNNVECIFKDSDGFVWFGTRNGLCRYDGYEFKIFKKNDNTNSIGGNRILDITEDNNGYIWIGTYKSGLSKLNKRTNEFTHYGVNEGIGERVNRVKKFKDGSIWICSNRGLANYNKENDTFQVFHANDGQKNKLRSDLVHDIILTSTGEIYVAPEFSGIQRLDLINGMFEDVFYARDSNLQTNYRKNIIEDKEGTLWIVAHNHGLSSYDLITKKSEIFTAQNSNLSTNVLMGNMALDAEGNIWLCTEENGLNIFNTKDKSFTYLKADKEREGAINTNHIYSIYIDNDQLIWIGTYDKGVNVYDPNKEKFKRTLFTNNDLEILKGHSVLDIYEDKKNRIWIGTDGNGLYKFETGHTPEHYFVNKNNPGNLLSSNIITSIGEDKSGNILLGTYTGGLISLNTEENRSKIYLPVYGAENKLSSTNVWEITKDSRNRIWLGLLGTGVDEFSPESETFTNFGPFSQSNFKIDFQNVMVITEDSDGDIWFGTEGRGLFILDYQTQQVYQIPNDTVYKIATEGIIKCIIQDKWGFLWIGTEDNGLFKFDKKTNSFLNYKIDESEDNIPVLSIQEDNLGYLWVSTSNGLYRYNGQTNNFNSFKIEEGLSSNDFNSDAMVKLSDGRILVGTKLGADVIDPEIIQLNQTIPKVIFTKLSVLNNEVFPNVKINDRIILSENITYANELILTWKEKIFILEFAALNYTLPKKCNYKYMLEGFDDDWVYTKSDRRFASYSNLDPGEYLFRVKASNNDDNWGDNEISLKIIVKPPFWNTLFSKVLMIFILFLFIFWIYKRRINIHKERFLKQQSEQETIIITLENEKLESELKKLAFSIINKNKLLIDQKNKLINLSNKAKESVKEGLKKIVESIDEDLDEEKDWKYIEPQIDKAYNQFITQLKTKFPDLTASEIRIAAYIRMNLSTKEICEFMNKTQRAVENDRYRLRKKLNLNPNDSIQNYLINL